jgi:hypothetical protein
VAEAAESSARASSAGSASIQGKTAELLGMSRRPAPEPNISEKTITKKQRVLKLMQSDEQMAAEDLEATTVEELVRRIKEAPKSQLIYQPACVGGTSIHFWASQVVGALRAVSATPDASVPAPEISTGRKVCAILAQNFPAFLLKILYAAKCWTNLKHFVPDLSRLESPRMFRSLQCRCLEVRGG